MIATLEKNLSELNGSPIVFPSDLTSEGKKKKYTNKEKKICNQV